MPTIAALIEAARAAALPGKEYVGGGRALSGRYHPTCRSTRPAAMASPQATHRPARISLAGEGVRGRRQLRPSIGRREEVAVGVGRDLDRGVPEPGLHHLQRQLQAAIDAAVDAPAGIEMPERMQGILRLAVRIDDASRDLHRVQAGIHDVGPALDAAIAVGEDQVELALRTSEAVLAQGVDDDRRQRNRAWLVLVLGAPSAA